MENITKNEKTLIVYENTKYISKIAENGNKFQEELKEKQKRLMMFYSH